LQPTIVNEENKRIQEKTRIKQDDLAEGIVDGYSKIVKEGREKKGLKQEELAKEIAEKESLIHSIESGHIKPSFKTAKKLEVYLNISLIEKYEKKIGKKDVNFKDELITIADLLRAKK
ncbi:MAG: TIGR00270 family protein, partial [Nanoarchaeota archaeon]|nr:TIGR00270 family protein [Nanoarchaeota archaeon]